MKNFIDIKNKLLLNIDSIASIAKINKIENGVHYQTTISFKHDIPNPKGPFNTVDTVLTYEEVKQLIQQAQET